MQCQIHLEHGWGSFSCLDGNEWKCRCLDQTPCGVLRGRVVFGLVKLRFIEYMMTTAAVRKYWDGLGREPVCQFELEGSRSHRPACMRAVT